MVFRTEDLGHIPLMLKGATRYDLSDPDQYEKLYRRLTNQPLVVAPPVGPFSIGGIIRSDRLHVNR